MWSGLGADLHSKRYVENNVPPLGAEDMGHVSLELLGAFMTTMNSSLSAQRLGSTRQAIAARIGVSHMTVQGTEAGRDHQEPDTSGHATTPTAVSIAVSS